MKSLLFLITLIVPYLTHADLIYRCWEKDASTTLENPQLFPGTLCLDELKLLNDKKALVRGSWDGKKFEKKLSLSEFDPHQGDRFTFYYTTLKFDQFKGSCNDREMISLELKFRSTIKGDWLSQFDVKGLHTYIPSTCSGDYQTDTYTYTIED